ncbi:MAG: hypothetical protein KGN79_02185 [Acidobacteriota bacterium]|nr:hypothetical protein [Acidobacteriota bacterium]
MLSLLRENEAMKPAVPMPLLVALSSQGDRESILRAVELVQRDISSYTVACEEHLERILLSGDDELDLEEFCKRLREDHTIESGPIRVRYLKTVRSAVEAEGKYMRQAGGSGNYGHCYLRIEPAERNGANQFRNDVSEDIIPAKFIPSVERGISTACAAGVLSDIAISSVAITLVNGSYHEQDSNEMAFRSAAIEAMKNACSKVSFDLLEPVAHVALETSHSLASWLVNDIRSRRGRFITVEQEPNLQITEATIPFDEVLRTSSLGRPRYKIRFAGYDVVSEDGGDSTSVPVTNPHNPLDLKSQRRAD